MKFRVIEHTSVDSTSERAFAELASGSAQLGSGQHGAGQLGSGQHGSARHGDVHTALEQTAGRGRRGASWHSARGDGLYMSIVLLPPPPPLSPAALTMAGGLAVHDALLELGLAHASLKWPNDVVVDGAKLAGVLVETRGLDPLHPHYVVGIGVNVRQRAFPRELTAARPVTSLALEGIDTAIDVVRDAVLRALARHLQRVREPAHELTSDFLGATRLARRLVQVDTAQETVRGRVLELTLPGGLVIERDDGSRCALALEHVRQVVESGR